MRTLDIQIFKSSVKPIPKDRFSRAMVHFLLLKQLYDEVHDSAIFYLVLH